LKQAVSERAEAKPTYLAGTRRLLGILLLVAVTLLLAACYEPAPDPTPLPPDDGTPVEVEPVEVNEPLDYEPWYEAGQLSQEHFFGTLTPLADGRVLILGGLEEFAASKNVADLASAVEIYYPEDRV
jgi:hypothetical protein